MIDGVRLTPLERVESPEGSVMRMLRSSDTIFEQFGEIYFSSVAPGAIKGWRLHQKLTMNLAVPMGEVRFVVHDARKDSVSCGATNEYVLGNDDYQLLTIPKGIWMSFGNRSSVMALVANCATQPHDPAEVLRCSFEDSPVPGAWR